MKTVLIKCYWCGVKITPENFGDSYTSDYDHIVSCKDCPRLVP